MTALLSVSKSCNPDRAVSAVSGSQWSPENTTAKYMQEERKILGYVMSGLKGPVWYVLMEMQATCAKTQGIETAGCAWGRAWKTRTMTLGC